MDHPPPILGGEVETGKLECGATVGNVRPKVAENTELPPTTDGKGAVVDTTDIADGPGGGFAGMVVRIKFWRSLNAWYKRALSSFNR